MGVINWARPRRVKPKLKNRRLIKARFFSFGLLIEAAFIMVEYLEIPLRWSGPRLLLVLALSSGCDPDRGWLSAGLCGGANGL